MKSETDKLQKLTDKFIDGEEGIEGVNNICTWDETDNRSSEYQYFRKQMTDEVIKACEGAKNAGATEILIKDAHDSARNLILKDLPDYVKLHRGWEGSLKHPKFPQRQ